MIFYDDACPLCSRGIRFVRANDHRQKFRYCPLPRKEKSIILQHHGKTLSRSSAILTIFQELTGLPRLMGHLGMMVPRPVRDGIYDWISRNRYRIPCKKSKKDR